MDASHEVPLAQPQPRRPHQLNLSNLHALANPPPYPSPPLPSTTKSRSEHRSSSKRGHTSSASHSTKQSSYQPFAAVAESTTRKESRTASRHSLRSHREGVDDSASESGASVLSALHETRARKVDGSAEWKERQKAARLLTDSPLRRYARWMGKSGKARWGIAVAIALVLWVKWSVGLGDYSGYNTPPLRGDFEAQRHWISMTSSSLPSHFSFLHASPTEPSVPLSEWYSRDPAYWGLDYPPLTAYHSLFLGFLARLDARTAKYVELRPAGGLGAEGAEWEERMRVMESEGGMKSWMRETVIGGDTLVWISAVLVFCAKNFGKGRGEKRMRVVMVAALSILLQPALILIDNGHFQYNSIMLGLTLWSVNFFQMDRDLLGAVAFVLSLCFKQMALYYSPVIFAYLLGKCLYLGGREGASLFLNLGFVTLSTFLLLFSPFVYPPSLLLQSLHRIFPFARGLFEDKVANAWCALNIVIKLRDLASVATLAKLALATTGLAVLPGVLGMLWVSWEAGKRKRDAEGMEVKTKAEETEKESMPTLILLPHALFVSSMAFFLFSFQVHEKSILLPLMPLTMLMGGREAGFGRMDWEWAILLNNVGVFSMWPLLKREGLGLQYLVLTLFWNFVIGYNPLSLRPSFVKFLSILSYSTILLLHTLEIVASPPQHLPDLFVVFNLTLSAGVFGLGFLWATKRSVQEGWAVVGLSLSTPRSPAPKPTPLPPRRKEREGDRLSVGKSTGRRAASIAESQGNPGHPPSRHRVDSSRPRDGEVRSVLGEVRSVLGKT